MKPQEVHMSPSVTGHSCRTRNRPSPFESCPVRRLAITLKHGHVAATLLAKQDHRRSCLPKRRTLQGTSSSAASGLLRGPAALGDHDPRLHSEHDRAQLPDTQPSKPVGIVPRPLPSNHTETWSRGSYATREYNTLAGMSGRRD
ncbi:hypothetical protein NDU88_002744 [Pleurodeles waltl]|uniref:Uncharacterized protein n=1 Tax=Pleurodeles waltl TaxID=8319 RepID=A0AAV7T4H7_PLEWA|nr:hypothetical protein NDU88_002744 [Pleurodeles waltl]